MTYVIQNINDRNLFWSNDWGWGSLEGCEEYTYEETTIYELPMEGEWTEKGAE